MRSEFVRLNSSHKLLALHYRVVLGFNFQVYEFTNEIGARKNPALYLGIAPDE